MAALSSGVLTFIGIVGAALILSCIMNSIVIYLIVADRKLRNATNLMIANLAVSDIFMAAFVLPQNIHDMTHVAEFYEGEVSCKIVNALPILCISSSIYCLCAMAIERHRAICILDTQPMSVRTARWVILGIWGLALLVSMPTVVEYSVYVYTHEVFVPLNQSLSSVVDLQPYVQSGELLPTWNFSVHENGTQYWGPSRACGSAEMPGVFSLVNGFFLLFVTYILPLIVICVNYGRLIFFINSKARETSSDGKQSQVSKRRVKVLKMLIIVAALFVVSWLPYFTLLIIAKLEGKDDSSELSGMVNSLKIGLSTFSVSYNVYIYIAYNTVFREGFRKLLCPCIRPTQIAPEDENTTHAPTG